MKLIFACFLILDYTGFIMKVIYLLQNGYEDIQLIEIEFSKIHQETPQKSLKTDLSKLSIFI